MSTEHILHLVQIAFYILGGILATLTYIKAKNGLLNTINTEYHKKVIERLSHLSDELYEEFDSSSPKYWAKNHPSKELVSRINEQIKDQKERFIGLKKEDRDIGIPVVESSAYLENLASKYRTDPFLPKSIRAAVVSFLEERLQAQQEAHIEVTEYYLEQLSRGKHWDTLDSNDGWIHNRILDHVYKRGFGVSQVQDKINNIRLEIQEYFESFNPIRH
jgi:hypothetical protein